MKMDGTLTPTARVGRHWLNAILRAQKVHIGDSLVSIDDLNIPTLQEEVRRTK